MVVIIYLGIGREVQNGCRYFPFCDDKGMGSWYGLRSMKVELQQAAEVVARATQAMRESAELRKRYESAIMILLSGMEFVLEKSNPEVRQHVHGLIVECKNIMNPVQDGPLKWIS